jgi:hypothetical protein
MPIVVEKPVSVAPSGATRWEPLNDFHVIDQLVAAQPTAVRGATYDAVFVWGDPPPATPSEVLIGTLPHPNLRLRAPLRVEVQREDDAIGVWSPDLEEFGYGPHLTAAIEDFQQTLVELYLTLEEDRPNLGPAMIAQWERLEQAIEQRP